MDEKLQKQERVVVPRSAADEQRFKIEKMMADPNRPVIIPEAKKPRAPRPPPEFNFDVMGSSAGAGSGEFHIYRGIRRREQNRVKWIETEAKKDEMDDDFQQRREDKMKTDNERTAKKRAKRQKKKEKMQLAKKQKWEVNEQQTGHADPNDSDEVKISDEDQEEKKQL